MNTDKIKLLEVDLQLFAKVKAPKGLVTIVESPKNGVKATTAQTKDGNTYTFAGDNWVEYAKQNGITDELSKAITYPSYVNANEANRFLNENITLYGGGKIPTTDFGAGIYDYISNDEAAAYKAGAGNNYYTNNNGVSTMQGYTPLGSYNDANLYGEALNQINQYKNQYAQAQAAGDTAGMNAAHAAAEALRAQFGYSGGVDGSDYIGLGYGYNNNVNSNANNGVGDFYWNVERPTYNYSEPQPTFESEYDPQIDKMLNEILNRDDFSYNVNADPLYQQYKNQYLREGQRAMNDTLASAAAGAGGMNSYAISAANQAQNYYNAQLGDKIPELYNLAYDMYLNDLDNKVMDLGLLNQMDETQYGRYRDTMNDWRNNRDFAYGKYTDDMAYWGNDRDFAYGMYQDDIARDQWQQKFNYEVGRDAVADSNDSFDKAYNQAMEFLSKGIMPSANILAKAGISTTEAQAFIAKVVAASTKSTGSGGGSSTGNNNGYTPNTGDSTSTPAPKPAGGDGNNNTTTNERDPKEYEIWGGSGDLTDAYYSVSAELRRMSNQGKSKDEMADTLADHLEEGKINSEQAASLRKNYGI